MQRRVNRWLILCDAIYVYIWSLFTKWFRRVDEHQSCATRDLTKPVIDFDWFSDGPAV